MVTDTRDTQSPRLSGLAHKLVEKGLLDIQKAAELRRTAAREGQSFVAQAVASGAVTSRAVAETAAEAFALPLLDLRALDMARAPLHTITDKLIRKHGMLPIMQRGRRLVVAVADPTDDQALRE